MPRTDVSNSLIHFTKGESKEDAFIRLKKIIREQTLIGGDSLIKGRFPCVCFSEAPLPNLKDGLINPSCYSRYSPFGILVAKEWLFERGGRPVIYESEEEYYSLPDSHKWRHVLYDLCRNPPVDFSWEREWRIQCEYLHFEKNEALIVLPDESWANRLIEEHESDQKWKLRQYELIFDDEMLAQMHYEMNDEPFEWNLVPLR
jgi:hypothetical protein